MILGIVLRYGYRPEDGHWADKASIPFDFWKMAEQNDITLCAILNPTDAARVCDICDGLIVPGSGNPVLPEYYGGEPTDEVIRFDEYGHDKQVIDLFVKAGKPIFGICRGCQLINVALGGTLYQDLVAQKGLVHFDPELRHEVRASEGSLLCRLFGERFLTNSTHHQAVKVVADGLRITARSSEGIVEAFEHKERPIFATQFHPERLTGVLWDDRTPDFLPLFEYFLTLCK